MTRWALTACLVVLSGACGAPAPTEIAIGQDVCAQCRMTLVSKATAAQIVSAGEEPVTFDEIGCLRDYMAAGTLSQDAVVYVADHRTGEWTEARRAVFTRTAVSTPMASGLLAHRDAVSRDADPAAQGGTPVATSTILTSPVRTTSP